MQIIIPNERSDRLISLFQMLSHTFPDHIEEFVEVSKKAKEGVVLSVEAKKAERTRKQEAYYRKWVREFGLFCGMTEGEMHEEILCQHFGSTEHATKFGIKRRPAKRSGDTNKLEYSELIDTLARVASEVGFYVPLPEERDGRFSVR